MIKVALVEDNTKLRDRLKELINQSEHLSCALAVDSVEKFLKYYNPSSEIDIVLLDIGLPGMSGIAGIPHIHKIAPDVDIVILTVHQDPYKIFNAICAGAIGYLLKDLSPFSEDSKKSFEALSRWNEKNSGQNSIDKKRNSSCSIFSRWIVLSICS